MSTTQTKRQPIDRATLTAKALPRAQVPGEPPGGG